MPSGARVFGLAPVSSSQWQCDAGPITLWSWTSRSFIASCLMGDHKGVHRERLYWERRCLCINVDEIFFTFLLLKWFIRHWRTDESRRRDCCNCTSGGLFMATMKLDHSIFENCHDQLDWFNFPLNNYNENSRKQFLKLHLMHFPILKLFACVIITIRIWIIFWTHQTK